MRPRGQQARLAVPQAEELSIASGERPRDGCRAGSAARAHHARALAHSRHWSGPLCQPMSKATCPSRYVKRRSARLEERHGHNGCKVDDGSIGLQGMPSRTWWRTGQLA
jgi:hypothetical protein